MNGKLSIKHQQLIWEKYTVLPELETCIREFRAIKKNMPLLYLFIEKYKQSPLKEIASFANGLEVDIEAVENAVASDCISVYMAVNTSEYLESADREYFEMFKEDLPEDEIIKYESGKAIFTKWTPDEWGYSDGDKSKLNKISRKLAKMEEKAPEEYEKHKDEIISILINSFDKVIKSNYFDNESVTFFVSIADDEQGNDLELVSSKKLNSDVLHNVFIKEREESIMTLNEEFKQLLSLQMKSENNDLLILREYLMDFKNRGMDEESMYKNLEEMRIGSDEETEDVLLELMDFVGDFVIHHYLSFSLRKIR